MTFGSTKWSLLEVINTMIMAILLSTPHSSGPMNTWSIIPVIYMIVCSCLYSALTNERFNIRGDKPVITASYLRCDFG